MASPSVGFVYILTNPSFPDVVKIGFGSRIVEDRVSELSTAVPTDFEIAYRATTMKPREVEQETHELLQWQRVDPGKEFFRTTVESARAAISHAAQYVNGLTVWAETMFTQGRPFPLDTQIRHVLPLEAGQWFVLLRYPDIFARRPNIVDIWHVRSDGDALEMIGSRTPRGRRRVQRRQPPRRYRPHPLPGSQAGSAQRMHHRTRTSDPRGPAGCNGYPIPATSAPAWPWCSKHATTARSWDGPGPPSGPRMERPSSSQASPLTRCLTLSWSASSKHCGYRHRGDGLRPTTTTPQGGTQPRSPDQWLNELLSRSNDSTRRERRSP